MVKTYKEVEKEYGKTIVQIIDEMKAEDYSMSAITRKLGLNNQSTLDNAYRKEKAYIFHKTTTFKGRGARERTAKLFKEETGLDLYEYIKTKYLNEHYSMQDIANELDAYTSLISKYIKEMGITKPISVAHRESIDTGKKNYKLMNQKSNETLMKSRYSKEKKKVSADEYFRDCLKASLVRKVTSDNLEVDIIIGYNSWGILKDREIDIPIIVHYLPKNAFLKISIEYQGYYHDTKEDEDKKKKDDIEIRGWHHIIVQHKNNIHVSAEKHATFIYDYIKSKVME